MIDTCPFCNEKMHAYNYRNDSILCFTCMCDGYPGWYTTKIKYDLFGGIQLYWYLFNIDGRHVAFLGQKKLNRLSIKLWGHDPDEIMINNVKTIYKDTWREFDGIDDMRVMASRLLKLLFYI